MSHILIVDDEMFFRTIISKVLVGHGYDISSVGSGGEALDVLAKETFDLMISDVNMTPMNGLELLERSRESYPDMGVIMLTGHDEIEIAVDSMKKGAFDFLVKPFEMNELFSTVRRSLRYYSAYPNSHPLERKMHLLEGLVTESAAMHEICDKIRHVAPTDVAVLLYGEKGADYELIARTLHYYSPRTAERFLKFDCLAHPPDTIGSELFGDEEEDKEEDSSSPQGKFAAAKRGTLFIDNIDAMPLDIQVRLLEVIQAKHISKTGYVQSDVRLIVASSENLGQLAEEGTFTENLYYRLSALSIYLPPLRTRSEDIPFLIDQAIQKNTASGENAPAFGLGVRDMLYRYPWPGNEKELDDTVRKILPLAKKGALTKDMIPEEIVKTMDLANASSGEAGAREQTKGQAFKAYLKKKHKKLFSGNSDST